MRKLLYLLAVAILISGCGSSGDRFDNHAHGNFITSSAEVTNHYLYALNDNGSISAYLLPVREQAHDHHHHHHHREVLAHGDHDDHDDEFEHEELAESPFTLDVVDPVDIVTVHDGRYLVVLESSGRTVIYSIEAETGFLTMVAQRTVSVGSARRLSASPNTFAVLGDQLSIHRVNDDGAISSAAYLEGTSTWTSVELDDDRAIAGTPEGVVSFNWESGHLIGSLNEVPLPGGSRGEIALIGSTAYVLNSDDRSLSALKFDSNDTLKLQNTYALPSALGELQLLTPISGGPDLLVAGDQDALLVEIDDDELEIEEAFTLTRPATRLFNVPETTVVLVGHDLGEGSSTILFDDHNAEVVEPGPGGEAPRAFCYSERSYILTETKEF